MSLNWSNIKLPSFTTLVQLNINAIWKQELSLFQKITLGQIRFFFTYPNGKIVQAVGAQRDAAVSTRAIMESIDSHLIRLIRGGTKTVLKLLNTVVSSLPMLQWLLHVIL